MIFIWIPKTAGTSVYEALRLTKGMKLFTENYHDFDNTGHVCFGHADVKQLIGNVIDVGYWRLNEKIAIVRNPYDRFISLFLDYQRTARIPQHMTASEFAHTLKHVTRKPTKSNAMDFSMCANQVDWLTQDTTVFFFKLFEELEKYLGVELSHINRGKENRWQEYYDDTLLQQVTELYAADFAILNYETYDNIQQLR
jgi:hypothetical protein